MIDPHQSPLGLLGSGQLGQMLIQSAKNHGYQVHVFDPAFQHSPCSLETSLHTEASFSDAEKVIAFSKQVSAVTYEFENIPLETAALVEKHSVLRPSSKVLETAQDRWKEKSFFMQHGFPTTRVKRIRSLTDLQTALTNIGFPCVLKTTRSGYDGKGQRKIESLAQAEKAWKDLQEVECILEGWEAFECEVSVVIARNASHQKATYGPFRNHHRNHILHTSLYPAGISPSIEKRLMEISLDLADAIALVGVLCIEFFVQDSGNILINEIAPRPHNSGHLTIEAFESSQFEQQLRCVCDLPMGSHGPKVPAALMLNILGDAWTHRSPELEKVASMKNTFLHMYGKIDARPGRKMGHATITGNDPKEVQQKLAEVEKLIYG